MTQVIEAIEHDGHGASGAHGWMACPAWRGGGGASLHSASGTVTHEVSAECLMHSRSPSDYVGKTFHVDGFDITFDADGAKRAAMYVDEVRARVEAVNGELFVEETMPIDHITGFTGARSTLDAGILPGAGSTEASIIDLKDGQGEVDAEDNPQLVIYALMFLDQYGLAADIETVRMVIVQPRLNAVKEWVLTVEQLEEWRVKVQQAGARCRIEPELAIPGDKQCRWCTRKATCPALRGEVFAAIEDNDPDEIASDDLATALSQVERIEQWCKAIRTEAEARLLDGRKVPGFKLVAGKKGARKWKSAGDAEALMKSMRLKAEDMYERSLISPTTAEKLSKDHAIGERQWAKLQTLIEQKDGSPTVVPETDRRPEYVPVQESFSPVSSS